MPVPIIETNAATALLRTEQSGAQALSPPKAFVTTGKAFTGVWDLTNPFGTFYENYTQVGAITFTVLGNACIGGTARVRLVANGSAITVPSNWTNIGTTAISIVAADVNVIYAVQAPGNQIDYSVRVN